MYSVLQLPPFFRLLLINLQQGSSTFQKQLGYQYSERRQEYRWHRLSCYSSPRYYDRNSSHGVGQLPRPYQE
jgi:hypothetical protein